MRSSILTKSGATAPPTANGTWEMKTHSLVKTLLLASTVLTSGIAMADYGTDAAHAYLDDVLSDDAPQMQVAAALSGTANMFNELYRVGLAYQGQGVDEGKVRQYVLGVAQEQHITDNDMFKRFMTLGVQAVKDGEAGRDHPSYAMKSTTAAKTNNLTCDVTRVAPTDDPNGYGEGKTMETLKGAVKLKFSTAGAVVMLPYNYQEKKATPAPRTLDASDDGKNWASEDSQSLSTTSAGFDYIDGPGIHRSTFKLTHCK